MSIPLHVIRRVIHFVLRIRHNHCGGADVLDQDHVRFRIWVNLESLLICLDPPE